MTDADTTAQTVLTTAGTTSIVARRSWHFAITKVIAIPLMVAGIGVLFFKDGFYSWPAANAAYHSLHPEQAILPHTEFDIHLQKILCFFLVPAGLALLGYFLYRSRGAYAFDGRTLRVPGHPPVPTAAMQQLDRSRWDRKGIARVTYQLADGGPRTLTLDGYVYEQGPTDRIFAHIVALFTAPPAAADAPVVADAAPVVADAAPGDPSADGGASSIADV